MSINATINTLKTAKVGDKVSMLTFTGMNLGQFEIVKAGKTKLAITKKDGTTAEFSREDGVQTNANNPRYANKIVDPIPETEKKAAPAKKTAPAKKATKKAEPEVEAEEVEAVEEAEEAEEAKVEKKATKTSKKAPAKKAPAKKVEKVEIPEDADDFGDEDMDDDFEEFEDEE